jgi:hypothetical protein
LIVAPDKAEADAEHDEGKTTQYPIDFGTSPSG